MTEQPIHSTQLLDDVYRKLAVAESILENEDATSMQFGEALGELASAVEIFDDWMKAHNDDVPMQWIIDLTQTASEEPPPF